MGKTRKGRRKLHAPAAKSKESKQKLKLEDLDKIEDDTTVGPNMDMDVTDKVSLKKSMAGSKATTNPFKGMKITTDLLKQQLPEFDARSAITSKTFKGMNLKKKEKRRLRHDMWMEKIDTVQAAKKAKKDKKKREQTVVVGDLSGMADALPTLELLMKKSSKETIAREEREKKVKGIQREKQRKKEMLDNLAVFSKVLEVPEFKSNSTEAILQHLQNKMKQDDMDS